MKKTQRVLPPRLLMILKYFLFMSYYGCHWSDLVRYARKINVRVKFHNDLAVICTNGIILNSSQQLQKTSMCETN